MTKQLNQQNRFYAIAPATNELGMADMWDVGVPNGNADAAFPAMLPG